ncbi:MAG: class I SAM-dependent methyltransferase [Verrucomicrobia bacterium]|nr:class I SAM-dependent methyltransferase [Verrucomicrobiota bacterium]MBU1909823.1 class I SAM-dependent methyltransferase [Verrucomicrobiota bacterium]
MTERYNVEQIRRYWTEQARLHKQSADASWSDRPVIDMEIQEISRRLADGDRVLDVGCANGYSTVQLAANKRIHIRGLDYIPEMIKNARERLNGLGGRLAGDVEFDVEDITALSEPDDAYDKVVVIRVLINLADWEQQVRGLRECARVLRPGGLLLLSEATVQGWQKMNAFRREWGLPDIPMPPFNRYVNQDEVVSAATPTLELLELSNFASTYYVGTRILKPLLAKALGGPVNVANPDTEWNRWFSQWPAIGEYGTQKLFVFQKQAGTSQPGMEVPAGNKEVGE